MASKTKILMLTPFVITSFCIYVRGLCFIELVAQKVQGYVHVSLFRSEWTENQYSVFLHVLFYVFSVYFMHGLTLVYIYIYIYISATVPQARRGVIVYSSEASSMISIPDVPNDSNDPTINDANDGWSFTNIRAAGPMPRLPPVPYATLEPLFRLPTSASKFD